MSRLTSRPDGVEFECRAGESVLEAALRAELTIAHACGGKARCSTCRLMIVAGAENCPPPNAAEAALKARLALGDDIRLACQLRPRGDVTFRRLVLDDTDLAIANQLIRSQPTRAGEMKTVAILFSDVAGFTGISEGLTPYDVMYLLNRYLTRMGEIIAANGGYFDKVIGDGVMALFGVRDEPDAPIRAVNAALQMLASVDRVKPYLRTIYGFDFDIRIGLHLGEALLGSLGPAGEERLTAIGDAVNIASRVEAANKEAGTRLLISEALHEQVRSQVETPDFVRIRPRGASERITLYEVTGLSPRAHAALNPPDEPGRRLRGGRTWTRALAASKLRNGEVRVLPARDIDIAVARVGRAVVAFNNACPHMRLPFFGEEIPPGGRLPPTPACSRIEPDLRIACRWHESVFDLRSGEIEVWCPTLREDGRENGMEMLGDISKNRAPLEIVPCHVDEGWIWIAAEGLTPAEGDDSLASGDDMVGVGL